MVLLTVRMTYLPPRAAAFAPGPEISKNVIKKLRKDLTSLNIPLPKVSSIKIPTKGVVKFYWKTELGSPFHEILKSRISDASRQQMSKLSISAITLKEPKKKTNPPPRPVAHHSPPSVLISQMTTIPQSALDAPSQLFPSDHTRIAQMDVPYSQYTMPGPVPSQSEVPVPMSSEMPGPYSIPVHQPETLSLPQSTPLEEVTSVVIGKRTSHSVSPPPSAKRCRSRSPSDDDELSLLHELGSLDEAMMFLAARQSRIREKLKDMGVQTVPEPNFLSRDQFELEIEAERKQRIECETVLMDIRRECRVPFIVPALFDAFIDISKLTTAAVDSLH
ncbi:uncharacterized protein EV420DRAFT_1485098 [Desarmillaria tabescens]|uniref:Uncharacterized protein n=1 Tax=Armillaria tabescens TaxID=1929756 RepID=A0AA39JI03_ARMTA|nr:uncharacterized protein EV420DRAFT_1485098 [Desarmillaria tabescens]KAK0443122.1 hypothetical protein EV420DRAFT_1485098 [Desarmillaria tabescens]